MVAASRTLPDLNQLDPTALKALILSQHEQLLSRDNEIEHLKLLIAKLRRMQFGRKSEELDRQIEQLELRLDELQATAAAALEKLDEDQRAEFDEAIAMLTGNLQKIAEHGRRADGIVRSMLLHSRGGTGEWQSVDLNGLIEETLNLAYHGARGQDPSFNITMERDLDRNLAPIEIVPQEFHSIGVGEVKFGIIIQASQPGAPIPLRQLAEQFVQFRDRNIGVILHCLPEMLRRVVSRAVKLYALFNRIPVRQDACRN